MVFLLMILCIIALDQWTKRLALKKLKSTDSRLILKNTVELTLHKNRGVALNLLENHPKFVRNITMSAIALLLLTLLKVIKENRFILTKVSLGFIIGGGIGNLIDRVKRGYVVDFFCFNFKKCPIFNIADMFIILGTIFLQFLYIFKKSPIN